MIIKRAYVDPSSVFFRFFFVLFSFFFFEATHETKINKVKKKNIQSIQPKIYIYIYKYVNGTKIYGQVIW